MVAVFTVPRLPTLDARLPSGTTGQGGHLRQTCRRSRASDRGLSHGRSRGSQSGRGRRGRAAARPRPAADSGGRHRGRPVPHRISHSILDRSSLRHLSLVRRPAVLERPADAAARTDAVLAILGQRMPKPRRWGAVVMRHAPTIPAVHGGAALAPSSAPSGTGPSVRDHQQHRLQRPRVQLADFGHGHLFRSRAATPPRLPPVVTVSSAPRAPIRPAAPKWVAGVDRNARPTCSETRIQLEGQGPDGLLPEQARRLAHQRHRHGRPGRRRAPRRTAADCASWSPPTTSTGVLGGTGGVSAGGGGRCGTNAAPPPSPGRRLAPGEAHGTRSRQEEPSGRRQTGRRRRRSVARTAHGHRFESGLP